MFNLAELFVQISGNAAPLNAQITAVKTSLVGLGATASGIGSGLLAGLGLTAALGGTALIGVGIAKAINAASDLNETVNKTGVIFGSSASVVLAAADEMASKFGVVKTEFMDGVSEIGNLLQGMGGMGQKEAADMAVEMAKAAADVGSIANKEFSESVDKVKAAIRGQSEPISAFGVDVQEAAVKLEAMRLGLVKGNAELTTQQKVAARASVTIRGLKFAQGDLENTSEGFANSWRGLWGRMTNVLAVAGNAMLPQVEGLLKSLHGIGKYLETFVAGEQFISVIHGITDGFAWLVGTAKEVGSAISELGLLIDKEFRYWHDGTGVVSEVGDSWTWLKGVASDVYNSIGAIWRNWSLIGEEVGLRVYGAMANVGAVFNWLIQAAGAFGSYVAGNWKELIYDGANAVWMIFSNLGSNMKTLWSAVWSYIQNPAGGFHFDFTPLLDGFKATAKELPQIAKPAWVSMEKEIDALHEQMIQRETKRLDGLNKGASKAKAEAGTPPVAREKGDETQVKEKKVEKLDLAGFADKLAEGAFGKAKEAARTATATERTAQAVEQLAEGQKKATSKGQVAMAVGPL